MAHKNDKEILEKEIKNLNEEIKQLGYKLTELLNLDCNFGYCSFDPEVHDVEETMKEVEEKKQLLEFLRKNLNTYKKAKRA